MKTLIRLSLSILSPLLFASAAGAANYKYTDLQTKDYDEMRDLVLKRVQKAKDLSVHGQKADAEEEGDAQALETLRDALQLLLSRPDTDNLIEKILPNLKSTLDGFNSYYDTFASLVAESLNRLNDKRLNVIYRTTYLYVLENSMAQLKPEIKRNAEVRKIVEKIRDAKVVLSEDIVKEKKLRAMANSVSPSETAKRILDQIPQETPTKNDSSG